MLFIGLLVFTLMNIVALLVLPFPAKQREQLFFIPIPFLTSTLLRIGALCHIIQKDQRDPNLKKHFKGKSVLYIANHNSMIDVPLLNTTHPITTLMKFEVLYIPFMTLPSIACGAITVKRKDAQSRRAAFYKSCERLQNGRPVFYFPEGTRGRGQGIKPYENIHLPLLKTAYKLGVPVVPITLRNTKDLLHYKYLIKPFHTLEIITHNYIQPEHFKDEESFTRTCWQQVCATLK